MSKITNLMRRTAIISGVTGALIIGATATANASVPAAPAPVAASSTGVSQAAQTEDPTTTLAHGDCKYILETAGYRFTTFRSSLCAAASFPYPGQAARITICTAGMTGSGVYPAIALAACTAATV